MSEKNNTKASAGTPVARRAMLVLAMWLGFWILALGLVCGLLWIPFAQLSYRSTIELSGWAAALAGLTLAWSLRPRRREKSDAAQVAPLSRETAQPLYAMVEGIGAGLGIDAPVNIHLVGEATAFIFGKRNWYGKVKSLEVGLGLPLVGSMSAAELGAIIAHEFGHFVAGDLSLGPWVYRTRNAIARTVGELDDSMFFLDLLFRSYGTWFLRLSSSVSRAQEYAADATSAKTFGVADSANALKKVHLIEPLWSSYFQLELVPALQHGARLPIFEGFRQFCRSASRRADVQEAIRKAQARPSSEFDTHPSLDERLDALQAPAGPALPLLADCFDLLGGEAATEQAWYELFPNDEAVVCDWPSYGEDVLQPRVAARFAGSWMDPQQLPLAQLPRMAGELDELWLRLRPESVSFLSRQGRRNHVADILEEWIIACLAQRGFGASVKPGQALCMQRGAQAVEPAALLRSALAGQLDAAQLIPFEAAA